MFFQREVLILFWLLLAGAGSVVGVVAIWAGLGRTFWFWRIAVLGGLLSLALVMSAYDLLLIFAVQSVVVVAPLMVFRLFRRRKEDEDGDRGRIQFTIRDLLLLTVVVAAVCAVVASMPSARWEFWEQILGLWNPLQPSLPMTWIGAILAMIGFVLGLFTLVATGIALTRTRLWLRLILLVVCFPAALMTGWLMLLRASDYFARGQTERPRVRRAAKVGLVLLTLIVLVPLSVVYWAIALPPRVPVVVLPGPNGYDDLAAAARELEGQLMPDADIATAGELEAFVTSHEHVFKKVRTGLAHDCQVPLQYESSDLPDNILGMRQLARAFAAKGKLAEMQGRTNDAMEAYLDSIRLGQAMECGGLVVNALVGWAMEGIGNARLAELRHSLTTGQCRELIVTLESLNTGREPLETLVARDRLWANIVYDWSDRLTMVLERAVNGEDSMQPVYESVTNRRQANFRLLTAGLAIRCYEADYGRPPDALADLVPEYLAEVPEDPFSGKPLVYRPDAEGYLLYSIGLDETDDGGEPATMAGGDILLDEPDEEPEKEPEPIDDESLWE